MMGESPKNCLRFLPRSVQNFSEGMSELRSQEFTHFDQVNFFKYIFTIKKSPHYTSHSGYELINLEYFRHILLNINRAANLIHFITQ